MHQSSNNLISLFIQDDPHSWPRLSSTKKHSLTHTLSLWLLCNIFTTVYNYSSSTTSFLDSLRDSTG